MKNIKNILLAVLILVASVGPVVRAEEPPEPIVVHLTLRSGETVFFTGEVALPTGTTELSGHTLDSSSVLAVLNDADVTDDSWAVSDLQYFDSFGSFLLNCINSEAVGNDCYDWHYAVDGVTPSEGVDQKILSGGESVYFFFSPQNRITLSSGAITTADSLTATAEKYNYEDNTWEVEDSVTLGVTQPDPLNEFNPPIEIMTSEVNSSGQVVFTSIPAGSYNVGIRDDYGYYFPTSPLSVTSAPVSSGGGSSSGSRSLASRKIAIPTVLGVQTKISFDLEKGLAFLTSQQKENGSFEQEIYTDWGAVAVASIPNQDIIPVLKLVKYLSGNKSEGQLLTDYERHAMALMALGLNPYNTNGENYIAKIVSSFDGNQFGDVDEDNDDIFALIVLLNAGYDTKDTMANQSLKFILNRQKENGSWDESVDMTGAAMVALVAWQDDEQVKNALTKALDFLKKVQKDNGGWNDSASSTAWAIGGLNALLEKPESFIKEGNTPLDYLATLQDTDGGVKNESLQNKIWETAYVVSALSGKTWNQILQKFEKSSATTEVSPVKVVKKEKPKDVAIVSEPQELAPSVVSDATEENKIEGKSAPQKSWFSILWDTVFGF